MTEVHNKRVFFSWKSFVICAGCRQSFLASQMGPHSQVVDQPMGENVSSIRMLQAGESVDPTFHRVNGLEVMQN